MKKRIGNDIPIVWTLTDTEGNPYDLTGKEFSVCMKLEGMCVYIPMVYTFTENVISFTFYGKDQPGTGIYDLILREGDSEVTYDVQGVVELVPHSWDEDEGDITIESEIATNGEVNVIEVVKVNGVALPVVDKAVDIAVPTELSELAGDDTHRTVTDAEKVAWNAKYDKPSTGIPASDLASGVIPDVSGFVDEAEMTAALAGKQNTISDLDTIRSGAAAGATAYQKPSTGIPKSDLAQAVQNSLGKADTAYQKPSSGIPASDIASGVIPDVSQFITKTVNDLVNYYTKSETYTRAEVEALIAAIPGLEFVTVATLPTASADTMNKIYCVPALNPQTQNLVDEYYTKDNGAQAQTRYTWELFGSAAIDLSGYVTTTDLNTALASYTTTTDLTTLLAGKQDTISDLATIRSGASAGATAYQKPSTGIPKTDLDSAVQTAVGNATITGKIFHGTCATAAATAAKVVACADFTSADLVKGAVIFVTFSATNSAAVADLTMNVNSTGAKGLKKISNATTRANLSAAGELRADQTYIFVYDGTAWVCLTLDYNTTYSALTQAAADEGTATTGRTISAKVLADTITNRIAGKQDVIDSDHKLDYSLIANTPTIPTVPAISNDIATDATSTTKTASPKAVKDYVDGKPQIPSGGTAGQVLGKVSGTDYDVEWVDQSGGGGREFRLISSGTVSQDVESLNITRDSDNLAFSLSEVIIYAKVRGNSQGYTGWFHIALDNDSWGMKYETGDVFNQFAADSSNPYYTVFGRFRRVDNFVFPVSAYRSLNNTSVKDSLYAIADNRWGYLTENITTFSDNIKRIRLFGYGNGGVGAGTQYWIYGIDA